MFENSGEQPKLPDADPYETDSNADFSERVRRAAEERAESAWTERDKSEAAQDQSGIPEDLEANPIPPELAFLTEEEWHDAVLSRPENMRKIVLEKRTAGTGAIRMLASKALGRLNDAAQEYDKALAADPKSEETEKATKRLKFWKQHRDLINDDPYISTILSDEQD